MTLSNVQMTSDKSPLQVHLVDIGVGNIGSVARCLDRLEIAYQKVTPTSPPDGSLPIVLPGVGSFGGIMQALKQNQFDERMVSMLKEGVPYLGLCVGLQVLFETSEESPDVKGLGLLPGITKKFTKGKVPQIGWNQICQNALKPDWPSGFVYFVNSFYVTPEEPTDSLYEAYYHQTFCAAAQRQNLTAFQFHPEKSGVFGHRLIQKWAQQVIPQYTGPDLSKAFEPTRTLETGGTV
jgi:glutamine amidotransferase